MRKMIAIIICAALFFVLTACGGSGVSREDYDGQNSQTEDLQENRSEQESAGDDSPTNDSDYDLTGDEDAAQSGEGEESLQNRLIGIWAEVDDGDFDGDTFVFFYVEFHPDGTGVYAEYDEEMPFLWTLDDIQLTLQYEDWSQTFDIHIAQRGSREILLTQHDPDGGYRISYIKIDSNTVRITSDELTENHLTGIWVNFNWGNIIDKEVHFPYTALEHGGTGLLVESGGDTAMISWSFEENQLTIVQNGESNIYDIEFYSSISGLEAKFVDGIGPFIKIDFEPVFPMDIGAQN